LAKAFENTPPVPFKSEKECISNAARLMAKYIVFYSTALIILIFVFLAVAFLKTADAVMIVVGAAAVLCTLLIVKILVYFAVTVLNAGKYKQNRQG